MRGLALSGGGFRSTLFHVGALVRLNELGLLKDLDEITSVSGGSIISAYLGYKWKELKFDKNNVATNFQIVIDPVIRFCDRSIDFSTILGGIINPLRRPSDLLINKYRKYLFGNATLQDLPATQGNPRFTIYSTSLQTGASVRFTRDYVGEYHLGKILNPSLELAIVVAASSGFPPPLCPVKVIFAPAKWEKTKISDLHEDEYLKSTMWLADGGIYDNLGLERLIKNCQTIFVSDAGAPFSIGRKMLYTRISQIARTKRTLDIMSEQVRSLRKIDLIKKFQAKQKSGCYWGINTKIDEYPLGINGMNPALIKDSETTQSLAKIRTRLNKFSLKEQGQLINWGYSLADAALRSRFDSKLPHAVEFPIPEHSLL